MKVRRKLRGALQQWPCQKSKTGPKLRRAFKRLGHFWEGRLKMPRNPFSLFYPKSAPMRPKRKPRRSKSRLRRNPCLTQRTSRRKVWNLSWPRLRRRDPWSRKYPRPRRPPRPHRQIRLLQEPQHLLQLVPAWSSWKPQKRAGLSGNSGSVRSITLLIQSPRRAPRVCWSPLMFTRLPAGAVYRLAAAARRILAGLQFHQIPQIRAVV